MGDKKGAVGTMEWSEEAKRRNQLAVRRIIRRKYPLTTTERWLLLQRIRVGRFIDDAECEKCPLADKDHTIGWLFDTKICVKDWLKRTKGDGRHISSSNPITYPL